MKQIMKMRYGWSLKSHGRLKAYHIARKITPDMFHSGKGVVEDRGTSRSRDCDDLFWYMIKGPVCHQLCHNRKDRSKGMNEGL